MGDYDIVGNPAFLKKNAQKNTVLTAKGFRKKMSSAFDGFDLDTSLTCLKHLDRLIADGLRLGILRKHATVAYEQQMEESFRLLEPLLQFKRGFEGTVIILLRGYDVQRLSRIENAKERKRALDRHMSRYHVMSPPIKGLVYRVILVMTPTIISFRDMKLALYKHCEACSAASAWLLKCIGCRLEVCSSFNCGCQLRYCSLNCFVADWLGQVKTPWAGYQKHPQCACRANYTNIDALD
jgi:hypothetical protein